MKILRKIQQKLTQKSKENAKNISFLSNLIIGFLIISVAFACLYPIRADVEVSSMENRIYRKGHKSFFLPVIGSCIQQKSIPCFTWFEKEWTGMR